MSGLPFTPARDQIVGGFLTSTRPAPGNVAPTMLSASATWSADSCLAGPDPSRASVALWVPEWCDETPLAPTYGGRVELAVDSEARGRSVVFTGRVDELARRPRLRHPGPDPGPPPTPSPLWSTGGTVGLDYRWRPTPGSLNNYGTTVDLDGDTLRVRFPTPSGREGSGYDHRDAPYAVIIHLGPGALNLTTVPGSGPYGVVWGERPPPLHPNGHPLDDARLYRGDVILGRLPAAATPGERRRVFASTPASDPRDPALLFPSGFGSLNYLQHGLVVVGWPGETVEIVTPRIYTVPPPHRAAATPGRWWQLSASDELAYLARDKVGAPPWPAETAVARLGRLADLAADLGLDLTADSPLVRVDDDLAALTVRPRDVDSYSLGELVAETLSSAAAWPYVTSAGTIAPGRVQSAPLELFPPEDVDVSPDVVSIPPSSVPYEGDRFTLDDLTTRWEIKAWTDDAEDPGKVTETTVAVDAPAASLRYGTASATVSTDAYNPDDPGDPAVELGPLLARLRRSLSATSAPRWVSLDTITLRRRDLATLDPATAWRLVDLDTRHGALVDVGLDGRPRFGLGAYQRVRGGRLDLSGTPGASTGASSADLSLTLEPAEVTGASSAALADFGPAYSLAELDTITLDQYNLISQVRSYR